MAVAHRAARWWADSFSPRISSPLCCSPYPLCCSRHGDTAFPLKRERKPERQKPESSGKCQTVDGPVVPHPPEPLLGGSPGHQPPGTFPQYGQSHPTTPNRHPELAKVFYKRRSWADVLQKLLLKLLRAPVCMKALVFSCPKPVCVLNC